MFNHGWWQYLGRLEKLLVATLQSLDRPAVAMGLDILQAAF
jgi:hypothetical protein